LEEINPHNAPQKIKEGNLIAAPTTAGWSLLCDARNSEGLKALRRIKKRNSDKGFTILVESDARLNLHVDEVPALAWDIIDTAEAPITLVLPKGKNVDPEALASDGSIAVRMVTEPEEIKLVRLVNGPVACTALTDDRGMTVNSIDEAGESVLSEVDYLLNLPVVPLIPRDGKTPIVRLEYDGEVKILRS